MYIGFILRNQGQCIVKGRVFTPFLMLDYLIITLNGTHHFKIVK